MSNAIFLRNNTVEFGSDEFDFSAYSEIHRQHWNHSKESKDLAVEDFFCWFLKENTEYKKDKVIIKFGEGKSSHTWRDFSQVINFFVPLMKKEKKHIFRISDESSMFSFFSQEIIFGRRYDGLLREEKTIREESEKDSWCCYEICKDEIIHIAEKKGIEVDKIDFDDVIRYVKKGVSWALDDVWEQIIEESISSSMKKE